MSQWPFTSISKKIMWQFLYPSKADEKAEHLYMYPSCSTWSHGFLTSQPLWNSVRKQKMNYSTQSERVCLWRVTLISGALHKKPCLGGKDSEAVFLVVFFLFIFGFWFVAIFYSAVKPITQTIKPFEYFYFSLSTWKSVKLNGTQFIHIGEIWFLIVQCWNILVAFSH